MKWCEALKGFECSQILGVGQRLPNALQGQVFCIGFGRVKCHYFIMCNF